MVVWFALIAGLCLSPSGAHAQFPSDLVLLLVRAENGPRLTELEKALAAHLSSFDVEVRQQEVIGLSSNSGELADEVRTVLAQSGALAGVWTDQGGSTTYVLIAGRQGNDQILVRSISETGSTAMLDALASMIRSALAPLLRPREKKPPPAEVQKENPPRQTLDKELPPIATLPVLEKEVSAGPELSVTTYARAGYAPLLGTGTARVLQAGQVGLGVLMLEHLEFELGADFVAPIKGEGMARNISLKRWPVRAVMGGYYSLLGVVDMSLRLGVVVDFIQVTGVDPDEIADDTFHVSPGFSCAPAIRYRVGPWLAIWIEGGFDFFRTEYNFNTDKRENLAIHLARVQGRLFVGLAVLFELT